MKKAVSLAVSILFFTASITLVWNTQPALASQTIYIRLDGSIDPPTAPILTFDNVIYNLTGNIYDFSVEIQKDNITLDGSGYALQGTGVQNPDYQGVRMNGRSNVTIRNIEIARWGTGIGLRNSSGNRICENEITGNRLYGISMFYGSCHNIVCRNKIANDTCGLKIFVSSNNSVYSNNMTGNVGPPTGVGLSIEDSADNTATGNVLTGNRFGIMLYESTNNTLRDNVMAHNIANLRVTGVKLSDFVNVIEPSNVVDAKPVYYLVNQKNMQVPSDAGYVAAVNCEGMLIKGQNLSNGGELMLAYTASSIIENVSMFNNYVGLYLFFSSGNSIFHNSFVNNTCSVLNHYSTNIWDLGYPLGGNYWSYYSGLDLHSGPFQNKAGSDAIGDSPLIVDAENQDRYPLMQRFQGPVRNLDSGESYPTIQEAINQAGEKETILALSGTYDENIVVNKTTSLIGEDQETTIIDGRAEYSVLWVRNADGVRIQGFRIRNGSIGLLITDSNDCVVTDNEITENEEGVRLERSNRNNISNNLIAVNRFRGVLCQNSSNDNDISGNTISDNELGIEIGFSNRTFVSANEIVNNTSGIFLVRSSWALVYQNKIANFYNGVVLSESCSENDILENIIVFNGNYGISITGSSENRIVGNNVTKNRHGFGIFESANNTMHHNSFIDNEDFTLSPNCMTFWDNGYPSGGNYWSDYSGTDFYSGSGQNETGSDGIGDAPHVIDAGNQDRYALMFPYNPMPWDLTGSTMWVPDRKCDIRDVALVAMRFGSVVGDGRYDRRADVMGSSYLVPDLKIDIRDVALLAKHFGEAY